MKVTTLLLSLLLGLANVNLMAQEQTADNPFSDAELEQMLAPIALYPDSLLTHILIAATYPLELVQADRWVSEHSDLEPSEALQRVEDQDWDPSVKALVAFPAVLNRLSEDLEWTRNMGDAFLQDEEQLLARVQSLRLKADQAGNLDSLENLDVVHEEENIIIQPVEREVIYVPYYDSRIVYGTWHWAHYPPVYWNLHSHHHYFHGGYYNHHYDVFSWYPRVRISTKFFFGLCNWRNRSVVVINRHHHYLNHYHDRRSHRHYLINRGHAKRWRHNAHHRRGVAYRSHRRINTIQQRSQRHRKYTERTVKSLRPSNRITTKASNRREREVRQRLRAGTRHRGNSRSLTARGRQNSVQPGKVENRRKYIKRRELPKTQRRHIRQKPTGKPVGRIARPNNKAISTNRAARNQQQSRQKPAKAYRKSAERKQHKTIQRSRKSVVRQHNNKRTNQNRRRHSSR